MDQVSTLSVNRIPIDGVLFAIEHPKLNAFAQCRILHKCRAAVFGIARAVLSALPACNVLYRLSGVEPPSDQIIL